MDFFLKIAFSNAMELKPKTNTHKGSRVHRPRVSIQKNFKRCEIWAMFMCDLHLLRADRNRHRFRDDFFALISIVQITDKTLKSNMASVKIHELIQSTLARHDTRFDTSISLFKFNGDLKRTFCRALTSSKAS